ncbi:MAG: stage III sporulation protein AG [Oscillospiraceae bacterium]|jgi:stage III sporulation protein AG|nr:Stage III sporulation protein AG [Ruminococcaceae bacterium BL-4]
MEAEKKDFFKRLMEHDFSRKMVLILAFAGIALIFLSSVFGKAGKETQQSVQTAASAVSSQESNQDYTAQMEQSLSELISQISGAGTPHVLVTLQQGTAQVYATEEKKTTQKAQDSSGSRNTDNSSLETKYILVRDANGNEHPVEITQQQPKIQGVVVTCPGADNPAVQEKIISAVTTAVGISSARVCVVRSDS